MDEAVTKPSPSSSRSLSYKNPSKLHGKTIPKHKSTKCSTKAPPAAHGCEPNCYGPVVTTPPPLPQSHGRCPIDALKFKVCANVLSLIKVGLPEYKECCPLLDGLVDLEAALCLCTAIKANIRGIHLDVPVSLNLILNKCGKSCLEDFTCPN